MEQVKFKNLVIDQANKLCSIDGEAIALTKKEYELVLFLLQHPNIVHSREDLVKLWDNSISNRAIDVMVARLRKKLGEYSKYLVTRLGFGYTFSTTE